MSKAMARFHALLDEMVLRGTRSSDTLDMGGGGANVK